MDEVQAVHRAIMMRRYGMTWEQTEHAGCTECLEDARAAIAALDACRAGAPTPPPPFIATDQANAAINDAYAFGREAGLREAAAVARRNADYVRYESDEAHCTAGEIEREILALIDAGGRP